MSLQIEDADVAAWIVKMERQMHALKEQIDGPWQPLKKLLRLEEFRDELRQKSPEGVTIAKLELMLTTWANDAKLSDGEKHWLEQSGVQNASTSLYVFGWEDLEHQTEECVKYLVEGRDKLLEHLFLLMGRRNLRTFYVGEPELVVVVNERVNIHVRVLYKMEYENDTD